MARKRRNKASQAGDATVVVSIRMPVELAERLRLQAEADERTQNRTAVRLLRKALGEAAGKASA